MQVGKRMMEFDFNPRSPHGERRHVTTPLLPVARISIHAPRTGSDGNGEGNTLNARISIHAPRTGSDQQFQCGLTRCIRFQSTLPVRGAWIEIKGAGKPLGQIIQLVDAVGQLLHLAHELSVTVYLKDCATQVMIQCHLVNPPTSYASRKIA